LLKMLRFRSIVLRGYSSVSARPNEDVEKMKRRLIWQSTKRGMKENELLLGAYARRELDTLSEDELSAFDALLQQPDPDVFNWITGKVDVPEELVGQIGPLTQRLQKYVLTNPILQQ
jgi:succinate dehydrogenase assembly factor 2